jgi:hypothetical protein
MTTLQAVFLGMMLAWTPGVVVLAFLLWREGIGLEEGGGWSPAMTSAARMTPIRANIVGSVLRRGQDQGFSQGLVLGFRKLGYVIAGILDVTSWRPRGNGIGSWNDRFQPRSAH